VNLVTALLALAILAASPAIAGCSGDMPYLAAASSPGLGFGFHGIVIAVWPDGRLLRASDLSDARQGYIQGHVSEDDMMALRTFIADSGVFEWLAVSHIDMADARLMLCSAQGRRVWREDANSPEASPLASIRNHLLALPYSDPRHVEPVPISQWTRWFR
jgi:hypothetical protein